MPDRKLKKLKKPSSSAGRKKPAGSKKAPAKSSSAGATKKKSVKKEPVKKSSKVKKPASSAVKHTAEKAAVLSSKPRVKKNEKVKKLDKKALAEKKAQTENQKKWSALYQKKSKDIKAGGFSIFEKYSAGSPIMHKTFGWGWILSSKNNRLEVIFEDKVRTLLSNLSSSHKTASFSRKGS